MATRTYKESSEKEPLPTIVSGLNPQGTVNWNLGPAALFEAAVRRGEGQVTAGGAFNAITKPHTGRSPNDKFVVREPSSEKDVWWGKVNQPLDPKHYEILLQDVLAHLSSQDELFVRDLFAGAEPKFRVPVRFVTPNAWHANFVYNMFIRPAAEELAGFAPSFTVLHAPELQADPARHGTKTGTFIVVNFGARTILIGGTRYAGEMKKSIFSI